MDDILPNFTGHAAGMQKNSNYAQSAGHLRGDSEMAAECVNPPSNARETEYRVICPVSV